MQDCNIGRSKIDLLSALVFIWGDRGFRQSVHIKSSLFAQVPGFSVRLAWLSMLIPRLLASPSTKRETKHLHKISGESFETRRTDTFEVGVAVLNEIFYGNFYARELGMPMGRQYGAQRGWGRNPLYL